MKNYIMIILIALDLISGSLYATNTFIQKHQHVHQHSHSLSSSSHSHTHSHSQASTNLADFFIPTDGYNIVSIVYTKERYAQFKYFISNPTLQSLFRPPIV